MSLPKITETIVGFKFEWESEQIQIDVSRIHNSNSRVEAEVAIATTAPGFPGHLHQANFNFLSTTARTNLAKSLTTRHEEINWPDILEQLAHYTLERVRRGEPVYELYSGDDVKAPQYLLYPLIVQNYPNVIFGDPGSLKSNLAVFLSQILMLPWQDNPANVRAPNEPVRSLYLDWETDKDTLAWLVTTVQRGNDLPILCLPYRHCSAPLHQDIEHLQHVIYENNIQVIIIDSLGLAAGGDLTKTDSPLAFFAALRQLRVSSLILAHNSKDPEARTKSIYGNQFFTAQARNIWEVKKQQEPDSAEAALALFHRKPPPFSKLHKPIGFKMLFDEVAGKMEIAPHDPRNVEEFLAGMTAATRIEELLRGQPLSELEIKNTLTDIKPNTITQAVKRLKEKNRITKLSSGKWGLSYAETT